MPADFRLQVGFTSHPKTLKLGRRLGPAGPWCFVRLIEFCALTRGRHRGDLAGMSDEDVEIAAGWDGEDGALVAELVDVGYLDGDAGERRMHDFEEHQPWLAGADRRSESARHAAKVKWIKARRQAGALPDPGAPRTNPHAARTDPLCPDTVTDTDSDPDSDPDSDTRASTMTADGLSVLVTQEWAWRHTIPPKWWPLMSTLAPYTHREVNEAKAEADAASGKPNIGLLLKIIERRRNEATAPVTRSHPPPGSEWAAGREKEHLEGARQRAPPEEADFSGGLEAVRGVVAALVEDEEP